MIGRREAMALLGAGLLSGCGAGEGVAPGTRGRAALLLPLTGPRAGLGERLRLAATLGGEAVGPGAEIEVLDAGGDGASAVRAAEAAVAGGAAMILGPLFSEQARAVAGAVGRGVPVVALSNDDALAGTGAFVYGVTPRHSARAVLGLAAARGLRDVALAAPPGAFGDRAVAGAEAAARAAGVALRPPVRTADPGALRAAIGDGPDALYLPSAGPELAGLARAAGGAQLLGSAQWSALPLEDRPELDGAWHAAPDPLRFAAFARALDERGGAPGIVSGLVFDAVEMARVLGRVGQQDRRGLTRREGFEGVLGRYRLRDGGLTERNLAVLAIEDGAVSVLGIPA